MRLPQGREVVDAWGGTRDADGSPWQEDTLSISFSTTKGVASTLLHIYADRGLIDYDTPVAEYWPEFAKRARSASPSASSCATRPVSTRFRDIIEHGREMLDWEHITSRIAAAAPRHAPGVSHGYHALTYGWLVGEIVRRVAGNKPFAELIESDLARPLGLDGLFCGVPADQLHRCATLMARGISDPLDDRRRYTRKVLQQAARWRDRLSRLGFRYDPSESIAALLAPGMEDLDFNSDEFRAASIPAANGFFTARSLARLYACLAQGGELDGVRMLSYDTLRRATEQQNRGAGRVIPVSMRWRLGYHRVFAMRARVRAASATSASVGREVGPTPSDSSRWPSP